MSVRPILCPVCWHEETLRARVGAHESCHDDPALMHWQRPHGGARGQVVSVWDGGCWLCEACGARMTPHHAAVLIDAALYCHDPDCDSIDEEGYYSDSRRAAAGGLGR